MVIKSISKKYIELFFLFWILASFYFLDNFIFVVLPFAFSAFAFFLILLLKSKVLPKHFFHFLFLNLLLLLIILISSISSELKLLSLQRVFINYLPIIAIVIFFIFSSVDRSFLVDFFKKNLFFIIFSCIFSLFLLVFGTIQWFSEEGSVNYIIPNTILSQRIMGEFPIYRAASFFVNPNTFGLWLAVGVAIAVAWFTDRRFLFLCSILLILIGTLLAFSRGAFLAIFVFLVVYNFLIKNFYFYIVSFVLLFLSSIIFLLGRNYINLYSGAESRFGYSLNSRDVAWDLLLNSIQNNPLLGVGFGVSNELILRKTDLEFSSHNLHLQFLAELGVVGYLIFLMVYFFPILYCFGFVKKGILVKENSFFIALLFAILVHQFFENTLFRSGFFTFFWFFLSCAPFFMNFYYVRSRKVI